MVTRCLCADRRDGIGDLLGAFQREHVTGIGAEDERRLRQRLGDRVGALFRGEPVAASDQYGHRQPAHRGQRLDPAVQVYRGPEAADRP